MIAAAPPPAMTEKTRRWMMLAMLLSLLIHGAIAGWLYFIRMPPVAVPYLQKKNPIPFQIKRVEMNASTLGARSSQSPDHIPTGQAPVSLPAFVPEGRPLEKAVETNAPRLVLPSPPQVPVAQSPELAPSAAGASSPYLASEKAQISAEITKFQVGPTSLGAPEFGDPLTSAAGGTSPSPGEGGNGSGSGAGAAGGGVPNFDSLTTGFRTPDPGLNPKLPEPVVLRLPGDILFDFDSAKLKPQATPLLDETVKIISRYPIAQIRVEGHTDTFGSDAYNLKLSEARARAVDQFLRQALAGKNYQVQSQGYGKTRPIVSSQGSIEQQQKNRRVEVIIQALQP
jgi:OOP family OmpA-OmpF porin